jgi:hypothetical protein
MTMMLSSSGVTPGLDLPVTKASDERKGSGLAGEACAPGREALQVKLGCHTRSRPTCDKDIKLGRKGSGLTRRGVTSCSRGQICHSRANQTHFQMFRQLHVRD